MAKEKDIEMQRERVQRQLSNIFLEEPLRAHTPVSEVDSENVPLFGRGENWPFTSRIQRPLSRSSDIGSVNGLVDTTKRYSGLRQSVIEMASQ